MSLSCANYLVSYSEEELVKKFLTLSKNDLFFLTGLLKIDTSAIPIF